MKYLSWLISCLQFVWRNVSPATFVRLCQWAVALGSLSCSSSTQQTGPIPNLQQVKPGLWRSGQPTTDAHWQQLRDLGITRVVKLNFEAEGSDAGAAVAGLVVYTLSLQPEGDKDILDALYNTFVAPDASRLAEAQAVIQLGGGVLVHCTHGQDRTGLVIGQFRVLSDSWTKEQAYHEMVAYGFHPLLRGLHDYWEGWSP